VIGIVWFEGGLVLLVVETGEVGEGDKTSETGVALAGCPTSMVQPTRLKNIKTYENTKKTIFIRVF
jgi:hypothetical protein